jgi:uncharacterized membrane protein
MSTARNFRKSFWLPRPKYALFGLIGLMMLTVIYKDRVLLDQQAPIWEHYRIFKWWLLPHGFAAALPLFLGPLQFSDRFRRRFLRWHRLIGRIYVCGVAVGVPFGVLIEYIKYRHGIGPLRLLIGTIGFGSLFLLTTGMAFLMARRRNIQAHRKWMTRSYAIALVFLEVRCVDQFAWLGKLTEGLSTLLETHFVSDLWMYIAFSLVVAELILLSEKSFKNRSLVKKTSPVGVA